MSKPCQNSSEPVSKIQKIFGLLVVMLLISTITVATRAEDISLADTTAITTDTDAFDEDLFFGEEASITYDPWEKTNRKISNFNTELDRYVMHPVVKVYTIIIPRFLRKNISNFFSNINYINVMVNNLLQLKFQRGITDIIRLTHNFTFGIGGLYDPATMLNIPKYNETWSQTLAHYGVPIGAYIELPIFGPNTVLTSIDIPLNLLTSPYSYARTIRDHQPVLTAIRIISTRARFQETLDAIDTLAIDPYLFKREAFVQKLQFEIMDGDHQDDPASP